jgi:hypothetical protein
MRGSFLSEDDAHEILQTFKSFSTLPLLEIIKSEIRLLGPVTFFSSGLLAWFATVPVSYYRQSLSDIPEDSIMQNVINRKGNIVSRQRYATRTYILGQM